MCDAAQLAHAELHARPFPVVATPSQIWHVAHWHDGGIAGEHEHLQRFPEGAAELPRNRFAAFATPAGELRVERHNEFTSYTLVRDDLSGRFPPLADAIATWFADIPGVPMARLRLSIAPAEDFVPTREHLVPILGDHSLCGATCSDGAGAVWTSFQADSEGWTRLLIHDHGLTSARRCGRLVQRVLEVETYRLMALIALPQARQLQGHLREREGRLSATVGRLADPATQTDDRAILDQLTALAIEVEDKRSSYARRANASAAYAAIMHDRLGDLRQAKVPRFQTISEFLDRRMDPALRTINDTASRLDQLSLRLDRATDLLRTRVDITLEDQNRSLLKSLDRRADTQLRLQETVEGLSVVAISYYLVGLTAYLLEGLKSTGLPVDKGLALLIAAPVIVLLVWRAVRRIRHAMTSPG